MVIYTKLVWSAELQPRYAVVPEEVAARRDGAEGQRQRGHGERPQGRLQAPEDDGGCGRAGAREDVCLWRRLIEHADAQRASLPRRTRAAANVAAHAAQQPAHERPRQGHMSADVRPT